MKNNKTPYQFDKDIGFWGIPYFSQGLTSVMDGEQIMVKNDQYGCRSISPFKTDHKDTIVTIGGSHSWGAGIETDQRYSEVLEQNIGKCVVNIGQASLGMDQICIAIMRKSEKYKPKIIIVEQYPWAVLRVTQNYVGDYIKPFFYLDSNKKIQLKKVPWFAKYRFIRVIIRNYRLYKKQLSEFQSGIDLSLSYDPMLDPMFLSWKTNHYLYLYELLEKILVIIRDYCRKNDIKLLFTLGTTHQQFVEIDYDNKSSLIDYSLPRKKLINILDSLAIDYLDTTDSMLKEHSLSDPVIFEDGHINIKGHKILAELIQQRLQDNKWL